MEDITAKLQLYHNLFRVCLIIAVICLAAAVVLFFVLKIYDVLGYLTGRSAKKQIYALQESSQASGRLMSRERTAMHQMAQQLKEDMGVIDSASPGVRMVENVVKNDSGSLAYQNAENTALPGQPASNGADDTALLNQNDAAVQTKSMVQHNAQLEPEEKRAKAPEYFKGGASEPRLEDGSTAILDIENVHIGTFVIEKEIILIHAEDVI